MSKNNYKTVVENNLKFFSEDKEEYTAFFKAAMKKFGIKSIASMSKETKKEFFNYIDNNYKAKNEMSTSAGAGAYNSKFAFGNKKKKTGYNDNLDESIENELSPRKSIALAISEVRNNLTEIERKINQAIKLKEDNKLGTNNLYKRTHNSLRKIGEQITRIVNNLQRIK